MLAAVRARTSATTEPVTGTLPPRIREFPQQDRPIRTPGTPLGNLAPTAAELVARDIAALLMVPAVMLIVWWVVGR